MRRTGWRVLSNVVEPGRRCRRGNRSVCGEDVVVDIDADADADVAEAVVGTVEAGIASPGLRRQRRLRRQRMANRTKGNTANREGEGSE